MFRCLLLKCFTQAVSIQRFSNGFIEKTNVHVTSRVITIFSFHQIKLYSIKMIRSSANFELYWCVYKISCSESKSTIALTWVWVLSLSCDSQWFCRRQRHQINVEIIIVHVKLYTIYIYICLIIKYVCALLFIYSFWFFILFLFLLSCQSGISFTQISGTSICIIWFFVHYKWQEMNIHVRTALVIYNFTF